MRHGLKLFPNPVTHVRLLRLVIVCVYSMPLCLPCVCVCVQNSVQCLYVCVCETVFLWATMPNVLEGMSRTLGCDVLPC